MIDRMGLEDSGKTIPSEEDLEREKIRDVVTRSLRKAFAVHESLGAAGEEVVQKNQFGETALRIDVEIEKAIIDFLREKEIPIRIISEEHGQVDCAPNPTYLGTLDGLDGSNRYQAGRGTERYGTMLGIFSNLDPTYGDYMSSGIMEHSTGRLFTADKGKKSFVFTEDTGKIPIHVSEREALDSQTKIYINEYYEVCRRVFSENLRGFKTVDPRAFTTYFSDVASGVADMALICTGKNNLEIAVGYGLVKEAGGSMLDLEGASLEDKKFLEWGQKENLPVITAATGALAMNLLAHIQRRDLLKS